MRQFMLARPDLPQWEGAEEYFACAWDVRAPNSTAPVMEIKQGSLAGCMAYVGHRDDGLTVAWLVNSRPIFTDQFQDALTTLIWNAVDTKLESVSDDLFTSSD